MKKLSDYKNEEALNLWAEIMPDLTAILKDESIRGGSKDKSILDLASALFTAHPKEIIRIVTAIDPTPVNGLNIITRLVNVFTEIISDEDMRVFFDLQGLKMGSASSGSVMGNTTANAV